MSEPQASPPGSEPEIQYGQRIVEDTERWAILLYASGGVGEEIGQSLVPWMAHWSIGDSETALDLAAALIAGQRDMGDTWRPIAGIDGQTGQIATGPTMVGALAMIRALEAHALPSVTDDPPGPFNIEWEPPALADPELKRLTRSPPPPYPLVMIFASGPAAERCGTVCLPYDEAYETPGKEAQICETVIRTWQQLRAHWRFVAAVAGATGRVLATPALIGQRASLQGLRGDTDTRAQSAART